MCFKVSMAALDWIWSGRSAAVIYFFYLVIKRNRKMCEMMSFYLNQRLQS